MRDDEFEWDDAKAAANLVRHSVSFGKAREAFEDPLALHRDDDRMDYGEDRYLTVGEAGGRLISVVWTSRDERIRIISARRPTVEERRAYRDQ
jgi:uncharacterized DUF497 family protein